MAINYAVNAACPKEGCGMCEVKNEDILKIACGYIDSSGFYTGGGMRIIVRIKTQMMYLIDSTGSVLKEYPVSTAKKGAGNESGSNKTPYGIHKIIKIAGRGNEKGVYYDNEFNAAGKAVIFTDSTDSPEDFVMTRVFVLEGLQEGINRGEGIDSFKRKIFVHGTNEEGLIGTPASKGCIRMRNDDIIELSEIIEEGTLLLIID